MKIKSAGLLLLGIGLALSLWPQASASSESEGIQAFQTVRAVLQHPRCQNCHIPGDAPLQFDQGRPHGQNVLRGATGTGALGLGCGTCHFDANPPASYGAHMPPGAPKWHLPPPETKMVFIGLSSSELCRTVKNPKTNGGKDLQALLEHVSADMLVLWGWNPGVGRAPVSVPHAEFVAKFKQWVDAGAPCPK
jgi:hypothetical protein